MLEHRERIYVGINCIWNASITRHLGTDRGMVMYGDCLVKLLRSYICSVILVTEMRHAQAWICIVFPWTGHISSFWRLAPWRQTSLRTLKTTKIQLSDSLICLTTAPCNTSVSLRKMREELINIPKVNCDNVFTFFDRFAAYGSSRKRIVAAKIISVNIFNKKWESDWEEIQYFGSIC